MAECDEHCTGTVHKYRSRNSAEYALVKSTSKARDVSILKSIINVKRRKCVCLPIWRIRERLKIDLARMPAL